MSYSPLVKLNTPSLKIENTILFHKIKLSIQKRVCKTIKAMNGDPQSGTKFPCYTGPIGRIKRNFYKI
jgi:hypothetical protein